MFRLLCCVLLALGFATPAIVDAQAQTRAYAPENLRTLSRQDQVRVISLEYQEQSNGRRIPDDQLRFYLDQVNRSDWTFSRIKQDIAQSLGGSAPRPPPVVADSIRCESENGRNRTCPTPWRGHSRLSRQLSKARCVQGQNWFSRPGQVTVSGGCRGMFAPGGDGSGAYSVTCSSNDGRQSSCAWDARRGRPYLAQKLSKAPCVEGRSWGYRGNAIWVSNGCRARFSAR